MGLLNLKTSGSAKAIENNSVKLNSVIEKKGILQNQVDLTLNKFAAIENLEKKVDCISAMQEKIMNSLGLISGDTATITSAMVSLDRLFSENNSIIMTIAENSKNIRSQLDSYINKKTEAKPEAKPEAKKPEVITRKPEAITNGNETPIQKAFKEFKAIYPGAFATHESNQEKAFQAFIDLIMIESIEGIENAMSKYSKLNTSIIEGEKVTKLICPRKNNQLFKNAILKIISETVCEKEEEEAKKPEAITNGKTFPKLGKEKITEENNSETFKKSIGYFISNLVGDCESDFIEVIKFLNGENVTEANKGEKVNMVFDWLKDNFTVKKSTVSDFVKFYLDNRKAISAHYAKMMN